MSAPGSADSASLMAALADAARLLEEGDSGGAAEAMASVMGRCKDVSSGGLTADEVSTARQLLDRCRHAESLLRRRVAAELAQSGTSRRAQAAYER
jgi:hypothetical protein